MSQLSQLDKMHRKDEGFQQPIMVDDLLKKMRMGRQTVSEIRMGDLSIPVRILSADEINAIRKEARVQAIALNGDETDENLYIQKKTLQKSSEIGENQMSVLSNKLLNSLSIEELRYLYEALITFWDTFNPAVEKITPDKFRTLVEELKKNAISWNDCTTPERRAIFTCFVELTQRPDTAISPMVN